MSFPLPSVQRNARFVGFECVVCSKQLEANYEEFVCPDCGLAGILDPVLDMAGIKQDLQNRPQNDLFPWAAAGPMWRFSPLLPYWPTAPHPAWSLGATPVQPAPDIAEPFGLGALFLKDDTGLPSASLKDRAAAMAIVHARYGGRQTLACASTGNAAASLAVLAARARMQAHIFVPEAAPRAKLAQLLIHGADIVPVAGTYDQAFDLSLKYISRNKWYSRNCAHNPLLVEGKKTAALELAWDLTCGFNPGDSLWLDAILVPVGDGCIVSSVAKACLQLAELGLVPKVPRVIGVQAAGANPLARAWAAQPDPGKLTGREIVRAIQPVQPRTVADSISVGIPRNRVKAWRYVAATGGAFIDVQDEAIVHAIKLLAQSAGIFAEPSGAAGFAGLQIALDAHLIHPGENVAVMITGHGLKDPLAALADLELPPSISPED